MLRGGILLTAIAPRLISNISLSRDRTNPQHSLYNNGKSSHPWMIESRFAAVQLALVWRSLPFLHVLPGLAEAMTPRAIAKFRPQITAAASPPDQPLTNPSPPLTTVDDPVPPAITTPPETAIAAELQPEELLAEPNSSDLEAAAAVTETHPQHTFWQHCRQQMGRGAKVIGAPLIWLGVAAFCGGTGYAAFQWLSTIPPFPECDRLWFFSLESDKLFCAEQAVRSGDPTALQAGIKLTGQWGNNHYLYPKAARLYQEWSKQLLEQAKHKALNDDLAGAIALASTIPPTNPVSQDAKTVILEWEKLSDRDQLLTNQVEAALKVQDWKRAEAELQPPATAISAYQQQQLNRLRARLLTERMAFNQLQQIQALVKAQPGNVETLGRAIQLATHINPASYLREVAQRDRQQWTEALMAIARTRLNSGDLPGAIAVARWLPAEVPVTTEVQDLVWVSRAQQAPPPSGQIVTAPHWWQQLTILASLHQIQPASPVYEFAQAPRSQVEQQVQDITQLSLAQMVAQLPYLPTLQVAIGMAQDIPLGRPHRVEAQTLIAEWQQAVQRVEDFPILLHARKLAAPGKVKNLQEAIASASQIPLGRALRPTAQAAIFDWRQHIQTIEDQPTLTQARQLANQNQLPEAIQTASQIAPGRALYEEAQIAIRTWTETLQTAADRPLLEEARTLARQGNLGAAMDVAYQIAPGRALYDEAQTAIAQWQTQVAATRRRRTRDAVDPAAAQREQAQPGGDRPGWR